MPGDEDDLNGTPNEAGTETEEELEDAAGGEDEDAGEGEGPDEEGQSEGDDAEELAAAPRKRNRANETIRSLRKAAQDRAEENANLRRRMDELEHTTRQRQQEPAETKEQETARLQLMTPDERAEYRFNKAEERNQRALAVIQLQSADLADQAAFSALKVDDPAAKKYASDVEKTLADLRKRGENASRETILNYLVGQKSREAMKKNGGRAARKGQDNIRRQQATPGNGRGDVQATRRVAGNTPRKRLEGQYI